MRQPPPSPQSACARFTWSTLSCALLLAALCLPAWAHAQQDPSERYRALINQALNEFRLHNWPEARALFRRAHVLLPNARTLRGMGMVSYEMRDYPQCIRDLRASLEDPRQPLTPGQREEVERLIKRALAFVGSYRVELSPEGAELRVDDKPARYEPDGSLLLAFGPHTLRAGAQGHVPQSSEVRVEGGEHTTLTFHLQEEPRPEVTRAAPPPPTAPPAPVQALPESTGGLRWTWVGLGATAAFAGATAAVWYTGQKKLDDRVQACLEAGPDCNDKTQDLDRHAAFTTAGWALSGAALAGTVLAAVFERPRKRDVEVSLGPTGLWMRGRF